METWCLDWKIEIKVAYYELDKRRWAKLAKRIDKKVGEWVKTN